MSAKFISRLTIMLLFLVAGFYGPARAFGQIGGSGSINGTITDPNGDVVPGATVVARNVATTIETTRQTTEAGLYVISPLPPGNYTITVTLKGFQTLIQEN